MAAMSEQARQWKKDFNVACGKLKRTTEQLESWKLLGGATTSERGRRITQGADVRAHAAELQIEMEKLMRRIEQLAKAKDQSDDSKATIAKWRNELTAAISDLRVVQQASKERAGSAAGGSPSVGAAAPADYQRMEDAPTPGVGMQAVSQRSLYEQQQQQLRAFDEPLAQLEGTVGNIGRAARQIQGEVSLQNRMLENTNEAVDRTQARMGRVQRLMYTLQESNQNSRKLMCWVIVLLCTLIGLFVWIVTS